MATDPVCGMYVDESTATLRLLRENRTYYFCASSCLETFAEPTARAARLRRRLAVAAAGATVAVLVAYLPAPPDVVWIALLSATVVQFYPGLDFYRGTWDALRNRVGNMDLLVAVGTTAAYGYSAAVLLLPGRLPPTLYFDASSLIITLILAGNYLEQATRARASGALTRLAELTPATATRVVDGVRSEVPIGSVAVGDRLLVRPGGRFPSDGEVLDGRSTANESLLTGEARPVEKAPGDRLLAGTINGVGAIEMRVSRTGSDTFLAEVGRLVQEAEIARVPLQRTADRIARYFAPAVIAGGILAGLGWYALGGASPTTALLVFVSVVITACPCAFGIATPAAILVGTGRAAESGILFRGADAIERTAGVERVLFDKTGTLTAGRPTVTDVTPVPGVEIPELLALATPVEAASEHPLGRAVVARARELGVRPRLADDVRTEPGKGVSGTVGGRRVFVGVVGPEELRAQPTLSEAARRLEAAGASWSAVVVDGVVTGVVGFSDPVVPTAAAAISRLRTSGLSVAMVTGDRPEVARSVASEVGIEKVDAALGPAGKVEVVRALQRDARRVAFVGDGINDAAALAAADVGIAVGAGTEVAKEAGQVILVGSDLRGVPAAIAIARATVRKVRQNLLWAIGYNAILLPLAAGALVPFYGFGVYRILPITGAIAMAASSTLVVLNSLSLRRVAPVIGRPPRSEIVPALAPAA